MKKKIIVIIILIAAILVTCLIGLELFREEPYAVLKDGTKIENPYELCIDETPVLYVASEEEGQQIISGIANYYNAGRKVEETFVEENITVQPARLKHNEHPGVNSVEEAIAYVMRGKDSLKRYEVVEGDTAKSIAEKYGLLYEDFRQWNMSTDLEAIKPGDVLKIYETEPLVHVSTKVRESYMDQVDYDTEYEDSDALYEDETKLKSKGKYGSKKVNALVTEINGKPINWKVLSEKVVKKPVAEVKWKGTKIRGTTVVKYAEQFIGNPYILGGESLTDGIDCSGFTMKVYENFGYTLPHGSQEQMQCGRAVSYEDAQPGDLIIYDGHVALYKGDDEVIHALSPWAGITTSPAKYRTILAVRRILD